MISWLSDARIVFLIWFIVVAILIAVVLIFIEVRLKKKSVLEKEKMVEKTPIDKMRIFLKKKASAREKLDIVSRTAKDYFMEKYAMSEKLDYGEMSKEFKKGGKIFEAKFCEEMFEAYYHDSSLDEKRVGELGNVLGKIYKKKDVVVKSPAKDGFVKDVQDAVAGTVGRYVKAKEEEMERAARIARRQEYELLSWIRKAIRMGYDKMKISSLLDNVGHTKKDIVRILDIYDKEIADIMKKSKEESPGEKKKGVAQRIVQNEKDRLGEVDLIR